jgi:NAD(P)-dependent dehydrogenase (short-subunit alcohol dehydrogenase family)
MTGLLEGKVAVVTGANTGISVLAKAATLLMLMGLLAACSTTAPSRAQLQKEQMYDEGCESNDVDLEDTYCGH